MKAPIASLFLITLISSLSLIPIFSIQAATSPVDSQLLQKAEKNWNQGDTSHADISSIPSTYHNSLRIPLTLIMDKNSEWSKDSIEFQVRKAEDIFNLCGVSLNPITYIEAQHPDFGNISGSKDTESLVYDDFPKGVLPRAVFVQDLEFDGISNSFAVILKEDPSYGYVFVGYESYRNHYPDSILAGQVLLTHELMHQFLSELHNHRTGNVLSGYFNQRMDGITNSQCKKLRKYSLNFFHNQSHTWLEFKGDPQFFPVKTQFLTEYNDIYQKIYKDKWNRQSHFEKIANQLDDLGEEKLPLICFNQAEPKTPIPADLTIRSQGGFVSKGVFIDLASQSKILNIQNLELLQNSGAPWPGEESQISKLRFWGQTPNKIDVTMISTIQGALFDERPGSRFLLRIKQTEQKNTYLCGSQKLLDY